MSAAELLEEAASHAAFAARCFRLLARHEHRDAEEALAKAARALAEAERLGAQAWDEAGKW